MVEEIIYICIHIYICPCILKSKPVYIISYCMYLCPACENKKEKEKL